ncbi:MAG: FHA domain-containing protein [Leptothrix sp. (in: b-proteobacteria)]
MSHVCPRGHFSSDADYCSECGKRIGAAAPAPKPAAPVLAPASLDAGIDTNAAARCPDCSTHRPAGARFCEVCRYDFQTQTAFSGLVAPAAAPAPVAAPTPTAPPPAPPVAATPAAPPVATAAVGVQRLLLRIVVDPALNTEPDPAEPCPQNAPERIFHLDLDENTLGRQYEGKGLHPEIVVQDPGISRRHLKFIRNATGGYGVLELGSANGTEFNRRALETGVVTAVQPGDQLTLGMWTRIHVETR